MAAIIIIFLVSFMLVALLVIVKAQNKILKELKNIRIPPPQKIEFPKIEFPKMEIPNIEIPPTKEYTLDLNPVIEAIKNIQISAPIQLPQKEGGSIDAEGFQEIATLMRVNQAEFQSGLEVFHKAIDKLLAQIPNGEKELDVQREFMQKFEDTLVKIQEKSAEAINENSLRLQEILAEFLNKENGK